MKVLHLGAGNIYGGIERALVSYAAGRAVSSEMIPEFALCFSGQLEMELKAEGVQVTVLGPARLSRPTSVLAVRNGLSTLLNETRPDVVVTHGPWVHCVFAPVVQRARLPMALFLHNPPATHWVDLLARRRIPQLVITNSRFTLQESKWWTRRTRAVACTYPFARPLAIGRQAARARLGISSNTVVVLQVSRLDPYKGHRLHLEALSRVGLDIDWIALFVGAAQPGKEAYARSLEGLRDSLGLESRVRFLGHRTDVYAVMAAADLFCHPNVAPEPFGMVFVEAMLAGVPVVATRMGGAEEILSEGGGELVPAEPGALASALERLITDRRRREDIGRRGQELARASYTVERGVRELAVVLSEIEGADPRSGPTAWA
jgi:glycosyltransferase involved in cell wall biosynthesis